jgi:hypothetical protein
MSAAPTIYVAVDEALINDPGYMAQATGRGVYAAGDVPPNAPLGYTEIGSSLENPAETFGTDGADGVLTLTVRHTSKKTALWMFREIRRVLHGKPLPLGVMTADSQALVQGEVRLMEDFANPDGGHSAVSQYLTTTVVTA